MELLEVGYGLKIGQTDGIWNVYAKSGSFALIETSDFFRVVVLLERPYEETKSLFDEYVLRSGASTQFPFWKVVGAAFASRSDQWLSLALTWFPNLVPSERIALRDHLVVVGKSKWASQRNRQMAEKYAKLTNGA